MQSHYPSQTQISHLTQIYKLKKIFKYWIKNYHDLFSIETYFPFQYFQHNQTANERNVSSVQYAGKCIQWERWFSSRAVTLRPSRNTFAYQAPPPEQCSSGCMKLLYTMSVDKLYNNKVQLWKLQCELTYESSLKHFGNLEQLHYNTLLYIFVVS